MAIDLSRATGGLSALIGAGQYVTGQAGLDWLKDQGQWERHHATQNLRHQQNIFGYQKDLQNQIFEREDTAIQRRAADLQAAGLSPILAAGQGARAGEAIRVSAPQMDITAGRQANVQRAAIKANLGKMVADVGRTVAETQLINSQAERNRVETGRVQELTPIEIEHAQLRLNEHKQTYHIRLNRALIDLATAVDKRNISYYTSLSAEIDYEYKNVLKEWITENNPKSADGIPLNPETMDYLIGVIVAEIRRKDRDFYEVIQGANIGSKGLRGAIGAAAGGAVGAFRKIVTRE